VSPDLSLARELLKDPRYPRTAQYDPEWQVDLDRGCPTFWLLESLCQVLDLKPGMRVLDLGCGKAGGAIFLAKEYGVQVWAVDPDIDPTENWQRICQAGLESQIFPLRANGLSLPFPEQFFDTVITVNSLQFFGTDDLYLRYRLIRFVKPDGQIGIVVPGFYKDFEGDLPANLPEHLKQYWDSCALCSWHSAEWWRRHWLKTNQVEVILADNFPEDEGYQTYLRWERIIQYEHKVAETDAGRHITFVRLVAQRKENV
jgi:SAM-dependent methyltransferase